MSTVVTFKQEDSDEGGVPTGPVFVIRAEGEAAELAALAGAPFDYRPEQATNLGWKTIREAAVVANEHGVALSHW